MELMSKQILAVLAAFCFIGEEKGDAAQKGNNELRPLRPLLFVFVALGFTPVFLRKWATPRNGFLCIVELDILFASA